MKKQADPRMHSAEHILNQTMVRLYGCGRCFSAHIERKKSKCDYYFDHELAGDEVEEIQSRVNRIIKSDLPVSATFIVKDKVQGLYDMDKLPMDLEGSVRVIHMGTYDACPCIGDHVTSTGEIGTFRITTTSFKSGVLRIRFKLS